ncbi:MAG: DUF1800 domain-containing protein [Cyanobacteria bacterium P01_G01_bin.39]
MRDKLRIGRKVSIISLVLSLILWSSFANPVVAENQVLSPEQRHILERLSFGVTTSQIEQIEQLGTEAYLQSQLNPQQVAESSSLNSYVAKLDLINQEPIALQKKISAYHQKLRKLQLSDKQNQQINRKIFKLKNQAANQSLNAHLARAIYSNRQLQEVMVDFWFNHFNVYLKKGPIRLWINDYENQIRFHALGNFRDLLGVTAKHPAMLIYLDNIKNTAPNSPLGKRQKIGLNENYARELMELHTLGIDGGYTQDDVIALARILTGWGVDNTGTKGDRKGFFFYNNRHDQNDKLFLGQTITANGIQEGEQALDILASHPATARFISYKLAQYFVADQPPVSLVDQLSQEFLDSEGNILTLMNTLIHSPEFNDPQYYQQKFKTPYQYVVSLVRMGEIKQPNYLRIRGMLEQLSMPLFQCLIPTGYKNTQEAWLNPQAMLQRTSLATAIANSKLNRNDPIQPQQLQRNFGELSQNTKQVIGKSPHRLRSALIMGSPEAMYR